MHHWRRRGGSATMAPMTYMPWSILLMGLSAAAVGVVGATFPPGRRLEAVLALVAGAGVGFAVLGAGLAAGVEETGQDFEALFFAGSIAGTLAVAAVLALLKRRAAAPASRD